MRKAFTLAEVLITLSIIGVVAAMTLPTLIQKQERKEYSVRLKKFYSMMSQAILLAENEFGEIENWSRSGNLTDDDPELAGQKNFAHTRDYWNKYYAPYIKTLKIERSTNNLNRNAKIYLADGSTIDGWNGGCFSFSYDVNGDKKPNMLGLDNFLFHICEAKSERALYLRNNRAFGPSGMDTAVDRESAMELCKDPYNRNCSSLLILYDDFEFKKDYPW